MTQDELDRLLEEALDVEPAAGYVTRVRARIAAEQVASARVHAWWPLGALAAAVLVLVASGLLEYDGSLLPSRGGQTAARTTRADGAARAAAGPSAVPGHKPVPVPAAAPSHQTAAEHAGPGALTDTRPRGGIASDASRSAENLPPVLIAPQDSDAIHLLLAFTGPATAVPAGGSGLQAPLQLTWIDVVPIAIDALPELPLLSTGELQ